MNMRIPLFLTYFILFLVTYNNLSGQNTLFEVRAGIPTMSTEVSSKYSKLETMYGQSNIRFIEINPLVSCIDSGSNGRMLLTIPWMDSLGILFETENIKYISEQDFVWHGVTPLSDTTNDYSGSAVIISNHLGKFGSINIEGKEYIIDFLGDSITTMSRNTALRSSTECIDSSYLESDSIIERTTTICKVRLLILYTEAIMDDVPDIEQRAITSFELTVQAHRNSSINQMNADLELAGIYVLQSFEEEGQNISQILNRCLISQAVEDLRSLHKADIVSVLFRNNFDYIATDAQGRTALTSWGFPLCVVR